MRLDKTLPYSPIHACEEDYVEALLSFATTSKILQTLCGGVHILDFLTRDPDLYEAVLQPKWRDWLRLFEIPDILDLLMREDLGILLQIYDREPSDVHESQGLHDRSFGQWRGGPLPPKSLLSYISRVRDLSLDRAFNADVLASDVAGTHNLTRQLAVGMKPKKAHEVENFAAFVDGVISELGVTDTHQITHVVDFGSGQNYLGRVLASPVYDRRVVAVESKEANITGAKGMDISARLAKKPVIKRNKKAFRTQQAELQMVDDGVAICGQAQLVAPEPSSQDCGFQTDPRQSTPILEASSDRQEVGNIHYIQHRIMDGDLRYVVSQLDINNNAEEEDSRSTETDGKSRYLFAKIVL